MMIGMDLLPYNFVDGAGFRFLMQLLAPEYEVPHSTTFSRTKLPELYLRTKEFVQELVTRAIRTGKYFIPYQKLYSNDG